MTARKRSRAWEEVNSEKRKAYQREWAKANRERLKANRSPRSLAWQEDNRRRQREYGERIAVIKLERGCEFVLEDGSLCGYREHPAALDFDHRDPSQKLFTISQRRTAPAHLLEAEIAKCDILCANHHRIRSATERHSMVGRSKPLRVVADLQPSLFEESA